MSVQEEVGKHVTKLLGCNPDSFTRACICAGKVLKPLLDMNAILDTNFSNLTRYRILAKLFGLFMLIIPDQNNDQSKEK